MSWLYATIRLCVALAIIIAPIASAQAQLQVVKTSQTVTVVAETAEALLDVATANAMDDCANMKRTGKGIDCLCCDTDKACPPQFCMANCFQFLGLVQQSGPVANAGTVMLRPAAPAHPPDWSDQPQPPPPRI